MQSDVKKTRPCRVGLKEVAKAGGRLKEFEDYDMTHDDIIFFKNMRAMFLIPKWECPKVTWICGPRGSGKTKLAQKLAGDDETNVYWKDNSKWWDGYDLQENIILDEWKPSRYWNVSNTLHFLGGEPLTVEFKDGLIPLCNRKHIIMTTVERPEKIWQENPSGEVKHLLKRIHEIIDLSDPVLRDQYWDDTKSST